MPAAESRPGVSVVICCHNGAERLPATLRHLAAQAVPAGLAWEALLIDNASTDGSAAVAGAVWPRGGPAPLRILAEPRLGVGHARVRGLDEAVYDVVSFVDDDNWVAPDWVATVWDVMTTRPEIDACGGDSEACPEGEPPSWFGRFASYWAVGRQGETAHDDAGHLWGAGLSVRTSAWRALRGGGFTLSLAGRRGTSLVSGEDVELCAALRLSGRRIRYDPRLRLRHFVPRTRLTWSYARGLCRGWGVASASLDPYLMAAGPGGLHGRLLRLWTWRALAVVTRLFGQCLVTAMRPGEGSAAVLRLETLRGRLSGLLAERRAWRANMRRVREAAWLRAPR